jgi:hypothetical protein
MEINTILIGETSETYMNYSQNLAVSTIPNFIIANGPLKNYKLISLFADRFINSMYYVFGLNVI